MYDHVWILDLKKEFHNQKYVIHICPEVINKSEDFEITNQL